MNEALKVLVGPDAAGLSAPTASRLKQRWADEYQSWRQKRLDDERWVYVWADGIVSGLRSENAKLRVLVVVDVNEQGEKHFLAIEDGAWESTQSWREVLLKRKARGMNAPKLGIGDGAMVLGSPWGDLSNDASAALLGAQTLNVLNRSTQIKSAKSKTGAARNLAGVLQKGGRKGV